MNVCFVGAAVRDGSLEAGTTDVREVVMLMSQGGHYQLMMLKGGLSVFDVRQSCSNIRGHEQDVVALDCSVRHNGEWLKCELSCLSRCDSSMSGIPADLRRSFISAIYNLANLVCVLQVVNLGKVSPLVLPVLQ